MQIFEHTTNINGNLTNYKIVCSYKSNRTGFKHTANLFISSYQLAETSIQYYNRTWESYTYQSVILQAINIALEETKEKIKRTTLQEIGEKTLRSQRAKDAVNAATAESQRMQELRDLYDHFLKVHR